MELNELIHGLRARGSGTTAVEAKTASRGLPTSLTPTLSAFANMPGGGLVILGLDEASDFEPQASQTPPWSLRRLRLGHARRSIRRSASASTSRSSKAWASSCARVHQAPASAKPCIVKKTGQAFLRFPDGDYALSRLEMDGFAANRTRPRFDEALVPAKPLSRH